MNGERHLLVHDLELIQLLRQVKQLHVEVEVEVKSVDALLDVENILGFLVGGIDVTDLCLPGRQVVILPSLQGLLEVVSNLLQFPALVEILPVRAENILNPLHVDAEPSLNLLGPYDLVRNVWKASDPVQHG